jgi:hypothetical protein
MARVKESKLETDDSDFRKKVLLIEEMFGIVQRDFLSSWEDLECLLKKRYMKKHSVKEK